MAGDERARADGKGWSAERRAAFLAALARSGNVRTAARAIGITHNAAYAKRRADAAFASCWKSAMRQSGKRLRAPGDAPPGLAIRRNCKGRMQIRTARDNEWCAERDDEFLSALSATGNVSASARAAGFQPHSAYARRGRFPAFGEQWEAALEEAAARLEWLVIKHATDALRPPRVDGDAAAAALPPPDPEIALNILKYRAAQKAGTLKRGGKQRREPSIEEVRDSIRAKLAAIRRHRGE